MENNNPATAKGRADAPAPATEPAPAPATANGDALATIRRADALREMETREDQYGHRVLYSVQFYKKNGEVVYLSHAYTCGLRMNMKERRMRGIQPCDSAGNKIGHSYAVSIDFLRMFNGKKVVL